MVNPRANPVFFWFCVFSSANRHSLFAISCFDFLNASQRWSTTPFSIRYFMFWFPQCQPEFPQCQPEVSATPFAIRYFVFWFPPCQPEVVNITIRHWMRQFAIRYFMMYTHGKHFEGPTTPFTIHYSFFGKWMREMYTVQGISNTIHHSLFVLGENGWDKD